MSRLYSWSHCSGCWEFYSYFDTKKEADIHISKKGFDPKYFKFE